MKCIVKYIIYRFRYKYYFWRVNIYNVWLYWGVSNVGCDNLLVLSVECVCLF